MGVNTRLETMATKTATDFTITYTTGDPSSSSAFTIADGGGVSSAEVGVFIGSQTALNAQLIADIESLRSKMNAGEGG